MKKEQFHDLGFEQLPDGTVRMTQQSSLDDPCMVDAHPAQIIHMARVLVGAMVSPEAERIKTLERRLRGMKDRFIEFRASLPADMYAETMEFYAWMEASIYVATEYCSDLTPESTLRKINPTHLATGMQ